MRERKGGIADMLGKDVVRSVVALRSAAVVGLSVGIDRTQVSSAGLALAGELVVSGAPWVKAGLRVQDLSDRCPSSVRHECRGFVAALRRSARNAGVDSGSRAWHATCESGERWASTSKKS
jgi:hypothetical protein